MIQFKIALWTGWLYQSTPKFFYTTSHLLKNFKVKKLFATATVNCKILFISKYTFLSRYWRRKNCAYLQECKIKMQRHSNLLLKNNFNRVLKFSRIINHNLSVPPIKCFEAANNLYRWRRLRARTCSLRISSV